MRLVRRHGMLTCVVALCVAVVSAGPAYATLTPVGAVVTGTAAGVVFNGASGFSCLTGNVTGTISAATNMSFGVTFSDGGGSPCHISALVVPVTCRGTLTLSVTSSLARANAQLATWLDKNIP